MHSATDLKGENRVKYWCTVKSSTLRLWMQGILSAFLINRCLFELMLAVFCILQVFNQVTCGLFIMQMMMLGFLGVKKFPWTPILLPLPFVTIAFQLTMNYLFDRPLSVLSLRAAHDLDVFDLSVQLEMTSNEVSTTAAADFYVNPAMYVTKDLDELLEEANKMDAILKSTREERRRPRSPEGSCDIFQSIESSEEVTPKMVSTT